MEKSLAQITLKNMSLLEGKLTNFMILLEHETFPPVCKTEISDRAPHLTKF